MSPSRPSWQKIRRAENLTEFLHEMRAIADDLTLAQNPVSEEDQVVHVLTQLG